nr:MAG TPA: hypothetical protein [Caudoviricetes sp.]
MRELVESLRRLYLAGKITADKINGMRSITKTEKAYILNG